jgi:hypothetical protein
MLLRDSCGGMAGWMMQASERTVQRSHLTRLWTTFGASLRLILQDGGAAFDACGSAPIGRRAVARPEDFMEVQSHGSPTTYLEVPHAPHIERAKITLRASHKQYAYNW